MYNGRKKDKEPLLYLPMFHAVVCVIALLWKGVPLYRSPNMPNGFWGESTSIAVCVRLVNCF